jgi:outer membrane lipoprotein-sorting protein
MALRERTRPFRAASRTLASLLALLALAAPLSAQSPKEIVDRVDRLLRGSSSHGKMEMRIKTEHWSRTLDMEVWSLGTEYSLVRVTAPPREAGTATLKAGNEVWNYLPRVDRTIKVPPSLMMGSWMGSHFTNDDLVKESRMVDDYDIAISFDGERNGVEVWEFSLTPKPEAAVVWGHIEEQVRKKDLMPTWARYYDEDGKLVRTLTFSDYKTMGGRLVPSVMKVVPTDKPDEYTMLVYKELEFDVGVTKDFFSLRNLRARGD